MEEETKVKKEYSSYKLIDIILGLISLVLLFLSIVLNKTNPFGVINSIKDNILLSKIIVIILAVYFVLLFILLNVYLVFFIKRIKLNIFLNEFIKGSFIIPLISSILLFVGIFLSINTVVGSSMNPTYYEDDRVLTLKSVEYDTNDAVIIKAENKYLIKRVVAKNGDHIVVNTSGEVYVNDNLICEGYYTTNKTYDIILKNNEYYCLGDNRAISRDSRYYGIFEIDDIYGKVIYKFK